LDFIGSLISLFIAVIAASTSGFIPAGYLALGLSYSFQLTTYLKLLVKMAAFGEAQMNCVERVLFYARNIPQEGGGPLEVDVSTIPESWPSEGVIEARDVTMRYRDGPLVLKGLNFNVKSCEKVGVAGRTGSGKSSMMIGLFRIQELASGSITIDGLDIATVPLNKLRTKLGIIPQDPIMFSASVRFNLDPFNAHTDEQIWDVLQSINLKEHIRSLPNGLSEEVAEGGDNFSAGQKQVSKFCAS
jgi:ABC-type multidrug transport system fused ATPase/permease subunit